MYAKLVVGNSAISALGAMRDIGRLITSGAPSISDLGSFNTTSSVIIDATPAGWTYVGSVTAADRPTIAATGASHAMVNDTNYNLCFSAPCLNSPTLKYAALTVAWQAGTTATIGSSFALTGAQSATNLGVLTNEGPRYFETSANAATNNEVLVASLIVTAGSIIHLIASPRHITIINEGRGLSAVWESSQTEAHTFYGTAPFIQYCHNDSSNFTRAPIIVPTATASTLSASILTAAFNVTNPNTGTNFGTYDPTDNMLINSGSLVQTLAGQRTNTITATGAPRYTISPVFYGLTTKGYPTQYVTGIVPIYWTGANIGTTGDIVDVNGDSYTFFGCGTGFGVILKTS